MAQPVDAALARSDRVRAGVPESVRRLPSSAIAPRVARRFTLAQEKCARAGSIFIVGGAESMSNIPLLFKQRPRKSLAA